MRKTAAIAALALSLALGPALGTPVALSSTPDTSGDRVVAAAWTEGGFNIYSRLGYRATIFTLYADGRLLTAGAEDGHGVGTYRLSHMSHHESTQLRIALVQSTSGVDFGDVPVADVGYTRTRARFSGRYISSRINALQMDMGLTRRQRTARHHLDALLQAAASVPSEDFSATTYEAQLLDVDDAVGTLEWQGPPLPSGPCGTLSATDYTAFPEDFHQGGAYTTGARSFTLWLRPLQPGESACRP